MNLNAQYMLVILNVLLSPCEALAIAKAKAKSIFVMKFSVSDLM